MKYLLSIILLTMFTLVQVNAATITWNGAADNDWHNDANWIGGAKPGMGDYAFINGGSFVVDISTTEVIQGVRVINATLNVTATGDFTCNAATLPGIWAQGDINNLGTINITNISHAGIQLTNKTFTNDGILNINGTSQSGINLTSNAIINNNGMATINGTTAHGIELGASTCTFNNNSGASLNIGNTGSIGGRGIFSRGAINTVSGSTIAIDNCVNVAIENFTGSTFTNDGSITLGAIANNSHMGIRNYTTFTNNGDITVSSVNLHRLANENGATFTNAGNYSSTDGGGGNKAIAAVGTGFMNNSGTIKGEGTIEGSAANFSNSGTFAPGFSPGTFTIQNGYSSNTYNVELAGPMSHDQLLLTGGVMADFVVGGTLNVVTIGGYTPALNQTFNILESINGYQGTYATINYPTASVEWEITYNTNDVTIKYIGVAVPIKLISFTATPIEKHIKVDWSTATEINNEGYNLERSEDGYRWESIAWVSSINKNSNTIQNYSYIDISPRIGTNYYRFIQKDVDGNESYSPVITADFNNKTKNKHLSIYPNPVSSFINIRLDNQETVQEINIFDQMGKKVLSTKTNTFKLDISDLVSGQYWITITTNLDISSHTFIKE